MFSILWLLVKPNGKAGPAVLRTIHGIPSLPKRLLRTILEDATDELDLAPPDRVYHCKCRRKEEAIATHTICGLRLQAASICYVRSFRDTHNAYASVSHDATLNGLAPTTNLAKHDPLNDHTSTTSSISKLVVKLALFVPTGVAAGRCLDNRLFDMTVLPTPKSDITKEHRHGWLDALT